MQKIDYAGEIKNVSLKDIKPQDNGKVEKVGLDFIFEIKIDDEIFKKIQKKIQSIYYQTDIVFRANNPIEFQCENDKKILRITNIDFKIPYATYSDKFHLINDKFLNPAKEFLNVKKSNEDINKNIDGEKQQLNNKNPKNLLINLFEEVDKQCKINAKKNLDDMKKYGIIAETILHTLLMIFSPTYRKLNSENKANNIASELYNDGFIDSYDVFSKTSEIKNQFSQPLNNIGTDLLLTKTHHILKAKIDLEK